MAKKVTRVEVFRKNQTPYGCDPDPAWYFRLRARNGEIIAASEGYTRKADAARGARRVLAAR